MAKVMRCQNCYQPLLVGVVCDNVVLYCRCFDDSAEDGPSEEELAQSVALEEAMKEEA